MSLLGLLALIGCQPNDCVAGYGRDASGNCVLLVDTGSADTAAVDTDEPGDTGLVDDTGVGETGDTGPPPCPKTAEQPACLAGNLYDTIQIAIEAASDGDEILVYPGTWAGQIDFLGKGIVVRSVAGASQTVLDGEGAGSVVLMRSSEPSTAVLEGFTVTGGTGTEDHGGAIFLENAYATVRHNLIVGNTAGVAGGVYMRQGAPTLTNNVIAFNEGGNGGAITCTACSGRVRYNTIYGNDAQNGPIGEWFWGVAEVEANVMIVTSSHDYAFFVMDPRGEEYGTDYNLLWPEHIEWVSGDPDAWPEAAGTVRADPMLADPEGGDWSLQPDSPAIDAGPAGETDPDGSPADLGAFGGAWGAW